MGKAFSISHIKVAIDRFSYKQQNRLANIVIVTIYDSTNAIFYEAVKFGEDLKVKVVDVKYWSSVTSSQTSHSPQD